MPVCREGTRAGRLTLAFTRMVQYNCTTGRAPGLVLGQERAHCIGQPNDPWERPANRGAHWSH